MGKVVFVLLKWKVTANEAAHAQKAEGLEAPVLVFPSNYKRHHQQEKQPLKSNWVGLARLATDLCRMGYI